MIPSEVKNLIRLAQRIWSQNLQWGETGFATAELQPLGILIVMHRNVGDRLRRLKRTISWEDIAYAKFDALDAKFTDMMKEFERYGHEV